MVRALFTRAREWVARRDRRWLDAALVVAAAAYTIAFVVHQLAGVADPYDIEWDTRVNTLPAFRWHGQGLFPHDVLVDRAWAQCPPLWRLLFWVGTVAMDPFVLSKVLSFALLAFLIYHAFRFGQHHGGPVMGATVVVLLLHCNFIWDRTWGSTARSFAFPFIVTFLRYAATGAERRALLMLLLLGASYPSGFLCCAMAYGLTLLVPFKLDRRWLRFAVVGGVAATIAAAMALTVPADIGHPIHWDELLTLKQKISGGLFPLEETHESIDRAAQSSLWNTYHGPALLLDKFGMRSGGALMVLVVGLLVMRAGRRLRDVPKIFPALLIASLVAFFVARLVAYRLYFPNRMLQYTWPPLFLMVLPLVAARALAIDRWRGAVAGGVLLVGVQLLFYGDGLAHRINRRDWSGDDTPVVRFIGTLPKDVLVAGSSHTCSGVQVFAHRQVLFSNISNIMHYYPHALEIERRAGAYFAAYYARDLADVRRLRDVFHVDYLIGDARDFGPDALARSQDAGLWGPEVRTMLAMGPRDQLYFSHPPPAALVFREGTTWVVDLRKL
jgi:hypothetical protein